MWGNADDVIRCVNKEDAKIAEVMLYIAVMLGTLNQMLFLVFSDFKM